MNFKAPSNLSHFMILLPPCWWWNHAQLCTDPQENLKEVLSPSYKYCNAINSSLADDYNVLLEMLMTLCISNTESIAGRKKKRTIRNKQKKSYGNPRKKSCIMSKKTSTEFENARWQVVPCSATVAMKTDQSNEFIHSRCEVCMMNPMDDAQGWLMFASNAQGGGHQIHPYFLCEHAGFLFLTG